MAVAARKERRQYLYWMVLGLILPFWHAVVAAHPMPESRVWIDTLPQGLQLTLEIPLNRLEFAYGKPLAEDSREVLSQHGDGLARYLLQHVGARSGNVGWQALRPQLSVVGADPAAELHVKMELRAPAGADPRQTTLLYDAVTHEVRTHRVQLFLRNDWAGGFAGEPPLPLGELDFQRNTLPLALGEVRTGGGVLRLVRAGAEHIADGADHMLFLLLLLVVAPLSAVAGTWSSARKPREAWRHVAWVVTAFTLGHMLTLVLGSSGWVRPPTKPVEVAVAVTIAIAALHTWRPVFARAEAAMALVFGLVHGFAFSASLGGSGLIIAQHAAALAAFNGGIELMQLATVLLVLPPLLWLARHHALAFARTRQAVATVALACAAVWIAERLGDAQWMLDWAWRSTALSALLLLWVLVAVLALRRMSPRSPLAGRAGFTGRR